MPLVLHSRGNAFKNLAIGNYKVDRFSNDIKKNIQKKSLLTLFVKHHIYFSA